MDTAAPEFPASSFDSLIACYLTTSLCSPGQEYSLDLKEFSAEASRLLFVPKTRTPTYWNCHYWLDLGNNADSGQFVLGQPENQRNKARDLRLPTAPELFPELINPKLDKKDRLPPCSALEALERQEPFVNQTLAYQALAMLARLLRYGRLSYHGGFVNLRTGRTTALPVDPVVWERMVGGGLSHARSKASLRLASPLLS
jgi:PRTRC genetic system ThiF family protein